jgi:hypothetical protein
MINILLLLLLLLLLLYVVAEFVQALRYKPRGRGFDFRWDRWEFSLIQSFRPH